MSSDTDKDKDKPGRPQDPPHEPPSLEMPVAIGGGYYEEMMGGPARVVTIPTNGAITNARKIATAAKVLYLKPTVEKVADKIWLVAGVVDANIAVIEAPEGLIVCDTGDNAKQGRMIREAIDQHIGKPIKAAILIHSHFGVGTGELGEDLMVVGHKNCDAAVETMIKSGGGLNVAIPEIGPMASKRSAIQGGNFLPKDGPDANLGVDYEVGSAIAYVKTTHTPENGETINVAGLPVQFFTEGYSDDHSLTAYAPSLNAIVGNNYVWGFTPNVYTLRGATYRDPQRWIAGIKQLRDLDADLLLGYLIKPVKGKEAVREAINLYLDNLSIIYDQTCRGILQGLTPDELRYFVYRPKHLSEFVYNNELYGCVAWFPPAIYDYQLGWNDLDGAKLFQLPPAETARRLVDLMGGINKAGIASEAALSRKEYAWAAQLASICQKADPQGRHHKRVKAEAMRQMAYRTTSTIARTFLLTEALSLEGKIGVPLLLMPDAKVIASDPAEYLNLFRVRLDPRKAETVDRLIAFAFDGDDPVGLHIRKGVAEYVQDLSGYYKQPDLTVEMTGEEWAELYLSRKQSGNPALAQLLDLFDKAPQANAAGQVTCGCAEFVHEHGVTESIAGLAG